MWQGLRAIVQARTQTQRKTSLKGFGLAGRWSMAGSFHDAVPAER